MSDTQCIVPKLTFLNAPLNLQWGSEIWAYIVAYNAYGDSEPSQIGNGAIVLVVPDAPLNLVEVYAQRDATSLGLDWIESEAPGGFRTNGGAPVLDYQVSYDQASDDWVVLETQILNTAYIAKDLTPGQTYQFKV